MKRKELTKHLTLAGAMHLAKKGFGAFTEIAIAEENKWQKKRVDIIGVNLKGRITIIEVKSCHADFMSDRKFPEYLPYCHKMYFLVADTKWMEPHYQHLRSLGIGVMLLDPETGFVKVDLLAKKREMDSKVRHRMLLRMTWRAATYSKRNCRRRRIFIPAEGV